MSNTTKRIYVEDFYETTITSVSIPSSWDFTMDVGVPVTNSSGWIIISPDDWNLRERCYYHTTSGNGYTIHVRWINRYSAKAHTQWEDVKINDVSNLFNYFSDITSSGFYIEKLWSLSVRVWWGPILKDWLCITLEDTDLVMTNDATNYIYYKHSDNIVKTTTSENTALLDEWIIVANVTTAWWVVSSVEYRNYKLQIRTIPTGPMWPTWLPGTIGTPWTTGQRITDKLVPPSWIIQSNHNDTISITFSDWSSWVYNLTSITQNSIDWKAIAISSGSNKVWVWWTNPDGTTWITYADGSYIDEVTAIYTFTWSPAYTDWINNFTDINVFNNDVNFKGRVSYPYNTMSLATGTTDTILFDAKKWTKQKYWLSWATWTYKMKFENLLPWCNYVFALVVTNYAKTLTKAATPIINSWSITTLYAVWWWFIFPQNPQLAPWTHIYVCDTFDTWLHISYLWLSVPL